MLGHRDQPRPYEGAPAPLPEPGGQRLFTDCDAAAQARTLFNRGAHARFVRAMPLLNARQLTKLRASGIIETREDARGKIEARLTPAAVAQMPEAAALIAATPVLVRKLVP